MSDYKQQISAFLDGEMSDEEIRRLQPELEAAEFSTASHYQMISSALRGDDIALLDISDQVRVAILQEASPTRSAATTVSAAGWFGITWLRPVAGMAMAALVAVVLVVSVNQEQAPDAAVTVVANQPLPATSSQVLAVRPLSSEVRPAANLDSYLKAHSEFAAQDTVQSRMPYARAVTYESKH